MLTRMLTVMVDWEKQSEELILLTWQTDDDRGQIAWIVGRPVGDNADTERHAVEQAVVELRASVPDSEHNLYRIIVSEVAQTVRTIRGAPNRPQTADADFGEQIAPPAVCAAAHRLVEAKLDPHADTAA